MKRDPADRQEVVPQDVVRLAGYGAPRAAQSRLYQRDQGVRRLRRLNNWVLAALFVGVGATSAAFSHAIPSTSSTASSSIVAALGSATGTPGAVVTAPGTRAPSLSQPVAISSGSSVAASSAASTGLGGGRVPSAARVVVATRGQS